MITYEQLHESRRVKEEAEEKYKKDYFCYACQCIQDAGFDDVDVCSIANPSLRGRLCVVATGYDYSPYEIKFFPLRKDGVLSKKSTYISGLRFLLDGVFIPTRNLQKLFTLADKDS